MIKAPSENGDVFVEVIDKFDCGEKEVFEVTLESNKTIKCTMEHKFMCEDKKNRPLIDIIIQNHKIVCED